MTSVVTGLWQLAVAMMILIHMSVSLPSLERHQRQIELKLMHDAGMRREYEKAAKLLETLMNYKRSIPRATGAEDDFDFFDKDAGDSWGSEDKLLKLKTCLQYVQNLHARTSLIKEKEVDKSVSEEAEEFNAHVKEKQLFPTDW